MTQKASSSSCLTGFQPQRGQLPAWLTPHADGLHASPLVGNQPRPFGSAAPFAYEPLGDEHASKVGLAGLSLVAFLGYLCATDLNCVYAHTAATRVASTV